MISSILKDPPDLVSIGAIRVSSLCPPPTHTSINSLNNMGWPISHGHHTLLKQCHCVLSNIAGRLHPATYNYDLFQCKEKSMAHKRSSPVQISNSPCLPPFPFTCSNLPGDTRAGKRIFTFLPSLMPFIL